MKGTKEMQGSPLVRDVIGRALDVHKTLGPGLLESPHAHGLERGRSPQKISSAIQKPRPVADKGIPVDCGHRVDLSVQEKLLLGLKRVERLPPTHEAQLLTCLKSSRRRRGLLINVRRRQNGLRGFLFD